MCTINFTLCAGLSRCVVFFFFKPKTAYYMRISDCSSVVCSSDLQRVDDTDLAAGDRMARQRVAGRAFLEGLASRFGGGGGGGGAPAHRGRRIGEHFLGLVDLGAFKAFQPRHLVERQIGEQPQETADVAIVGVAPELPVIVDRKSTRLNSSH